MKAVAGIFISLLLSIQMCNAQDNQYRGTYDLFFFYHEPSTSVESTGKIYLDNNNDAFSSLYSPALPSLSNQVRFSYTNKRSTIFPHILSYRTWGIDIPIKEIGTFSLTKTYSEVNTYRTVSYWMTDRIQFTSYNLNFSRELFDGLHAGIGFNNFNANDELPISYDLPYSLNHYYPNLVYYSLNFGASYTYDLATTEKYSHNAEIDVSIMNINISGGTVIPERDKFSIGYISKYKGTELIKGKDNLQADIEVEYSELLNSTDYKRISLGGEIKLLEIVSLRGGYFIFQGPVSTIYNTTYGFGLTFPLKLVSLIPLEIGIDYAHLKNSSMAIVYATPTDKYFDTFTINARYEFY
jgi:hypothetical protein